MRLFAALGDLACADCADQVERRLEKHEGVRWAGVHLPTSTMAVDFDAVSVEESSLRLAAEETGVGWLADFPNRGAAERASLAWLEGRERALGFRFAGALGLAFLVWTGGWLELSPYFLAFLSAVLILVCGAPLQAALRHCLRHRRMDAAALAAVGTWASFLSTLLHAVLPQAGADLSGWLALSVAVSAAGAVCQARWNRREAESAEILTRSMPRTVRVLRDGAETRVPATEVKPREIVVVLPGEPIGVDGEVAQGSSIVDESFLLGEGVQVRKSPGCHVLAGTHNKEARLEINTEHWGDASFLGTLIESIRDGQSSRSTPVPFADQAARYAGPVSLVLAAAAAGFWFHQGENARAATAGLGFLSFAMAPGLLLAGPVAVALLGRGGGVNFIDENAAERASEIEMVVLGKTGLLSRSKPEVWAVHAAAGVAEDEVLRLALLAGGVPRHPYAEAVRRYAGNPGRDAAAVAAAGLDYYPGRGVRSLVEEGEVWVGSPGWLKGRGIEGDPGLESASLWVAKGRTLVGALDLSDGLKGGARESIRAIQDLGLEVLMVSGDAEPKVRAAAEALGVDNYSSGISAGDQLSLVAGLQARGKRVAAVGQGLMEAPILAQADLGIALGDGVTADILLKRDDASALPSAVRAARRVRLGVRFNALAIGLPHAAAAVWAAWGQASALAAEAACAAGLFAAAAWSLSLRLEGK